MQTVCRQYNVLLWCLVLCLFVGCGAHTSSTTPQNPTPNCPLTADLAEALTQVNIAFSQSSRAPAFKRTHARFMQLQHDFNLPSSICADFAQRRIGREQYHASAICLNQRLTAVRAMSLAFDEAKLQSQDPRQLAWRLDAKIDWIRQTLACETKALAGTPRGGESSQEDAIRLQTPTLHMTTALMCERRTKEGAFEAVDACNGATLSSGDRFKLAVTTNTTAHLYFYLYNGSGQFQMFFPDKGVKNLTESNKTYMLPNMSWMRLDNVSGVFEHVLVVASRKPIDALEELRGADLPPTQSGDFAPKAREIRGIIEPLITRGAHIEEGKPIQFPDAGDAFVVPVLVKDAHTVAVEYEIYHVQSPFDE